MTSPKRVIFAHLAPLMGYGESVTYRRPSAWALPAIAVALISSSAIASAAVPDAIAVSVMNGTPVVTWTLPAGVEAAAVEIAPDPELEPLGDFPIQNRVAWDKQLAPGQTSWTPDGVLDNGRYFVHVQGRTGAVYTWSPLTEFTIVDAQVAPRITWAGLRDGSATVRWSLPPGVVVQSVELARAAPTREGGGFLIENIVDARLLIGSNATEWRSSKSLPPGRYYAHVGGRHTSCGSCPGVSWSAVRSVSVPGSTATSAGGESGQRSSGSGKAARVIRVLSDRTLLIRLPSGRRVNVRLIGVRSPGRRARVCASRTTKESLKALVRSGRVVLRRGSTPAVP